ncbi:MAG: hypothetical protein VX460_01035 [Planctomycetota bacterium]|nr:hypothetical protein [Planctomycetota bacterium]
MTEHDWMNEDEMRRILGADPDPSLTADQRRAIVRRVRAAEEAALDRVLGTAEVELPVGLADRVRARVASERASGPRGEQRRPSALRLVGGGALLAAAAALALALLRPGPARGPAGPEVADASSAERGEAFDEELVAALPELEELGVLLDLDPIEADVLFLFDPEDELLIDLLEENG